MWFHLSGKRRNQFLRVGFLLASVAIKKDSPSLRQTLRVGKFMLVFAARSSSS